MVQAIRDQWVLVAAVVVALENAVSVASLLLLTEATLTEVVKARDEEKMSAGLE